jgi:hypothetical protein
MPTLEPVKRKRICEPGIDEIHADFSFHSTFLNVLECERGTRGEKGALVDWQSGVTGFGRSSRSHCAGRKVRSSG